MLIIGRPKEPKPKLIRMGVRLDLETYKKLEELCKRTHLTKSDVVRKSLILILENEGGIFNDGKQF